ncbi:Transcription factor Sox-13 [Zancudomyces culisetae]|uniref:Transcription factor Sox-13 n=1 Tax=Zancudomyces culisetae TaxID=1213189 RepID=A0A1R1PVV7_ZANCU|nr:Transcription factor Sox-13 [Zancudomyces culisetae]|eukprot:OMH85106.1 Transcription factor Sox-13 [Zancudomyces culisetae]
MYQLHPNTKVSPPTKTGNSFMLYRKDKTKQLRQMFPSLNQRDISKICGELWKVASAGTKSYYQNQYKMNELSRKQLNKVDVDPYCNTPFLLGENDSNIYFEKNASNNTFNVNNYIHANITKNVDISGISDDINNNNCCIYTSYLQ